MLDSLTQWLRRLEVVDERGEMPEENPAEAEARDSARRRAYFALCVWILFPALGIFVVLDAWAGRWRESLTGLTFLVLLLLGIIVFRSRASIRWLVRVGAALALGLTALETHFGLNQEVTFLWFYPVPIAIFFLLGRREGALWALTALAIAMSLVLGVPGGHVYNSDTILIFGLTFGLVCLLAFVLESSRRRLIETLHGESAALREALGQIEALRELMPICAQCKSVRDDQGYWHQLESYLRTHTAAELEPALCPECAASASWPVESERLLQEVELT